MIFASGGPQLDAALSIADRILPKRVRGFVEFWRGNALRERILAALAQSDFYVSMTRSDGTATSVLEAMSCGAFPILSDIPANRPLVDTAAGIGALVPADDPAALARQLHGCLNDVARYRGMQGPIRDRVQSFADATVNHAVLAERLSWAAQVPRGRPS